MQQHELHRQGRAAGRGTHLPGDRAPPTLQVELGQASLQGRRPRNEDYAGAALPDGAARLTKGIVLAVADGVGSHANGRVAAEQSVRGLLSDYYATPDTWSVARSLTAVLEATNRWLLDHARRGGASTAMATTLTAVVLRGARYHVAHVGDSRAYLWRDGQLTLLTEDHTWKQPQLGNVLRRAVGLDGALALDHAVNALQAGDRFVLVTDGIWSALGAAGLAAAVARHADPRAADNCTALVADVRAVPWLDPLDGLVAGSRRPAPPRLLPGQRFDGLEVLELLHESRLTLLYKVRFAPTAAGAAAPPLPPLVLKTLPATAADVHAAAALLREEWLARRAPAPHVPRVVDRAGRSHLYFLMAWHDGAALGARLARGQRFAPHEVVQLGIQLLRGVADLHRVGIVHRDLRPDNLHLDRRGQLRILDFGAAAADSEDFRALDRSGAPSYRAPERFAVQTHDAAPGLPASSLAADRASDLYACGVTLYQLLTGKYPYGVVEPFHGLRLGAPTPPSRHRRATPRGFERVLLKACARDPNERYQTADQFLRALEQDTGTALAVPLARSPRPRGQSTTLKAVALASLALGLALRVILRRR